MAGTGGVYDGDQVDIGNGQQIDLYKAKDVTITKDDTVAWGFQSGDMVTVDKTNADVEGTSDAQGSSAASVNYDSLGTATLNLRATTPMYKDMLDSYNKKEMFRFWVTDPFVKVGGDHCMITKAPTTTRGKDVPGASFSIEIFDYDIDVPS